MITRKLEQQILKSLEYFPSVAILGPRQAGKTTLAKILMSKVGKEVIYVDLENPENQSMVSEPILFFQANIEKCIFIDEIQRKPELFPILRSTIDENRVPARFVLLGSASHDLLFLSSETLTGRIVFTELTPFLLSEINEQVQMNDHWLFGGFPQPCLINDYNFRADWFKSFFLTYVERDFRILGLNANSDALSRFFRMMAYENGNTLNKSNLAKSLGRNLTQIDNFINYFQQAFLLRVLPSWSGNLKKRLVKSPKIYLRDSGLLHYLLNIRNLNDLISHPALGNSWEGYALEQIIRELDDEFDYYFYRTQDGTECDLVLVRSNKPFCAVEMKFTSSPKRTKSLTTAIADLETRYNFIIVPQVKQPYPLDEKIWVTDLPGFIDKIRKIS